jgi:hypothetical protein
MTLRMSSNSTQELQKQTVQQQQQQQQALCELVLSTVTSSGAVTHTVMPSCSVQY